jgi:hypothetical protein
VLLSALGACGHPTSADRPDVLLVVIDTLRADRSGVLPDGPSAMPALSALGRSIRNGVAMPAMRWREPSRAPPARKSPMPAISAIWIARWRSMKRCATLSRKLSADQWSAGRAAGRPPSTGSG